MSKGQTRSSLIEMIAELKSGIGKLSDIIFENMNQIQNNLSELQAEEKVIERLREGISKLKVNDMSLRALGDMLEGLSVKILSLQAPVSRDLRRVLSSFRMIYDLERISRDMYNAYSNILKVNIQNIEAYKKQISLIMDVIGNGKSLLRQFTKIYKLSAQDTDYDFKQVIQQSEKLDSEIDAIFENSSNQLISMANNNEITPETGYNFLSSLRSLERMGDHCCNLIERTIYIQNGEKLIIK